MNNLIRVFVIMFGFFGIAPAISYPMQIADDSEHVDMATQRVAELTKSLMTADKNEKNEIFNRIKIILDENPENINVRKMYANNLLAEGRYPEGLKNLEIINKQHLTRTDLLAECMVKERLGKKDENCYRKVIQLSEKASIVDSDYITAIFFVDEKRFSILTERLIKEGKFKESDFLVFTLGKEKMLREFFP
ncbi:MULTISPECIES: hypothetical protein [unclassified Brenneria]|uniref:hypothetical protein n=1 Tax=unclassified Brenneria TaxID=2634434 RepID=UPI0029C16FF2|nr:MULTISPECIES: hypothetical protein [unclassified Brenneria]MDX5630379.1 hypothetical protein [Brenneria sp. L3-3Z]MDX5697524.1 hypothetical protein [Brenneria sp. L4-2C]